MQSVITDWWPKDNSAQTERLLEAVERSDPVDFSPAPPTPEAKGDASMTITDDMIRELITMMSDAGVPQRGHDRQLLGLASALGYPQGYLTIPVSAFEKAKDSLTAGLTAYKQRKGTAS